MMLIGMLALSLVMTTSCESKISSISANELKQVPITVYLAGDSTMSNYSRSRAPRAGWGQVFAEMFDENIHVKNEASSGRSSKSFIMEGRLKSILNRLKPGDYLFIQFGHNDEKTEDPTRYTNPATTFKSYLKQYIDGARAKGAFPVLVTPVERRVFSADGKAQDTHGLYPAAIRELGQQENVPVIDLTTKSKGLFNQLGPEKTKDIFLWLNPNETRNYPNGVKDNTHFQENGAREIARLVTEGMIELNLQLGAHIAE
jgi:lysophospholipase L1-like esterase